MSANFIKVTHYMGQDMIPPRWGLGSSDEGVAYIRWLDGDDRKVFINRVLGDKYKVIPHPAVPDGIWATYVAHELGR